mmetsp:Transcript_2148/g.3738  ORF Transcript_2148/g.3738 Transcript_2148/m.3738 type:complete len:83 (+) Transcript_2148:121-369(+)
MQCEDSSIYITSLVIPLQIGSNVFLENTNRFHSTCMEIRMRACVRHSMHSHHCGTTPLCAWLDDLHIAVQAFSFWHVVESWH